MLLYCFEQTIAQDLPADLRMHAFSHTFYLPSLMSFSVFGAYLIRKSTTTPAKKPVIAAVLVSRRPPQDANRLTNGERPPDANRLHHRHPRRHGHRREGVLDDVLAADDLGLAWRVDLYRWSASFLISMTGKRTSRICVETAERPHETSAGEEGADGRQGHASDVVLKAPAEEECAQG